MVFTSSSVMQVIPMAKPRYLFFNQNSYISVCPAKGTPGSVTASGCLPSRGVLLMGLCLLLRELVLTSAANWAYKACRQCLELCSRLDSAVRSSLSFLVNPTAYVTNILHILLLYFIFSKSAAPCLHSGQIKSSGSTSPS